jgi:hypothetical protein
MQTPNAAMALKALGAMMLELTGNRRNGHGFLLTA